MTHAPMKKMLACAAILVAFPALSQASSFVSVAQHCGAPMPTNVIPEASAVLTEATERFVADGWSALGETVSDQNTATDLRELAKAGLVEFVRFEETESGLSAFATLTVSGRGSTAGTPDPKISVFRKSSTGAVLLLAAYRFQDNQGINLRCTAFSSEENEQEYLAVFEPKSVLSIVREKLSDPSFDTMSIGNTQHGAEGEGYTWGEVSLAPLRSSGLPFTLRMAAQSYVKPLR
ncbi:MAG: hypothetical protein AAGF55_09080 [Pseudomonadota bacterium]